MRKDLLKPSQNLPHLSVSQRPSLYSNLVYTHKRQAKFNLKNEQFTAAPEDMMTKRTSNIDFDHHRVGSILACLPKHLREPIIEKLQTQDPNIGHLALRFEDLIHADQQGLSSLLATIDQEDLAYAMLTASEPLQQRVYATLNKGQSEQLRTLIVQLSHASDTNQQQKRKTYDQQQHIYSQPMDTLPSTLPFNSKQVNELELDSQDAQLGIISTAARMRQQQQLTIDPPGISDDNIEEGLIKSINNEMQKACESAMAQVLSNYNPEIAAAVLCRRLDRQQILSEMLDLEGLEALESLNLEDMEQLLHSIMKLGSKG